MSKLEHYRKEIDKIDKKMIRLLKERLQQVKKIKEWKDENKSHIYMPDREKKVYEKVAKNVDNSSYYPYFHNIFREIMSSNIAIEDPNIKIGYLGPIGSFTQQASIHKFGNSIPLVPLHSISGVFYKIKSEEVRYGVVPLENSQEGIVNETLDNLIESNIHIYAEIKLPIQHALLSYEKTLDSIKKIYTHRQAFYQCKKWIESNIRHEFEWIETTSTSKAVEIISNSKEKNAAAIGSAIASEHYDIPILYKNTTSIDNNFTRFIVLSKSIAKKSQSHHKSRTSIIFPLSDNPGSLYEILRSIYKARINMTCIESRPQKGHLWSYTFYLELEGDYKNKKIQQVLKKIQKRTQELKVLGSYPLEN